MSFRRIMVLIMIGSLLTLTWPGLCYAEPSNSGDKEKQPIRKVLKHVFIITLPGISNKDLSAAYTPNINGLAASGIKATAIGILPAETEQFLGALYSGFDSGGSPGDKNNAPSLSGMLDSSGRSAVAISAGPTGLPANLKGIHQIQLSDTDYKEIDKKVIDATIDYFNKKHPFISTVVLPGAEYAIQDQKSLNKKAISFINKADEQVGRLLRELRSQGIYDNCLVVVTGGTSEGRLKSGSIDLDRVMVPLIMSGPGLKTGVNLPPVRIIDVAPTIAMLTGVTLSHHSQGLVLWNAIMSGQGYSETYLLQKRVKELSSAHIDKIKDSYQLESDKISIHTQKEKVNKEKKQIEDRINHKQKELDAMATRLRVYKITGILFLVGSVVGYVVEYFLLRKRFLMF